MRVVFMGTPVFAVPCLEMLADAAEIVGVITQPDRPRGRGGSIRESAVKRRALVLNLPIMQPEKPRDEAFLAQLRRWRPDIIIVAAYGQILPVAVLELPPLGCVNLHASLLPRWRGAAPIPAAILAGDARAGISIMKMDEGLDTGPVYRQQSIPLSQQITAPALHDELSELGARAMARILPELAAGRLIAQPQDESRATYAPMLKKSDGRIDWQQSARQIERQLRAYLPWPGSFTEWRGRRLILRGGEVICGQFAAGQAFAQDGRLAIGCGKGALLPLSLQREGKRVLSAAEFARGEPAIFNARFAE